MQIDDVNLAEGVEKLLAHAAKGDVIEIAVIGDIGDNAAARLLDTPLAEAQEFDIIIANPLGILFADALPIDLKIIIDQAVNPLSLVGAVAAVGRVANDNLNRLFVFDAGGAGGFALDILGKRHGVGAGGMIFQRIGEIDIETLITREGIARLFKQNPNFGMGDGVRGNEQFKAKQTREQIFLYMARPLAFLPGVVAVRLANVLDDAIEKCARSGGWIEDEGIFIIQPFLALKGGSE